jgi:A/G-specific adenine glycosylase
MKQTGNEAGIGPALCAWYQREKRDLPWRRTSDPYAVWVSEIMLQQTRVETVLPYYRAFLERWPTLDALATADIGGVLKAWEGLGYYSRARNLLAGARYVVREHGGVVPADGEALRKVPGIGAYTAGAIQSIAFDLPVPAVDANVLRVFSRILAMEAPVDAPEGYNRITAQIRQALASCRPGVFNQAVMELGALVCLPKTPRCDICPVSGECAARRAGRAADFPVKAPPAPKRTIWLAVGVVRDPEGNVLARCRAGKGLLAGLWEFPNWEIAAPDDAERALISGLGALGLEVLSLRAAGEARHVFTHRVWEMRGFLARVGPAAAPDGWEWLTREALEARAWPSAMKRWRALAFGPDA